MRRLIIFGCGNFGQVAHHYFVHDSPYEVVAFTADADLGTPDSFLELPVVPFEALAKSYPPGDHDVFVAVGLRNVNRQRASRVEQAERMGYRIASYVGSRALVAHGLQPQPNTWIMDGAQLHPAVDIGRNVIIWSGSTIGFKSRIGDHCWISGGLVGESVTVGEGTFIGLGATVASFASVGSHNIIGAGALILKDTKDAEIYRGHASKPSRVPSTRFTRFNG